MPLPRELLDYDTFALDVTVSGGSVAVGLDESPGSSLADLQQSMSMSGGTGVGGGGRRAPMPTMPPRTENGTNVGDFPDLCYDMLEWFEFPAFEILVTFQVSQSVDQIITE